MDTASVIVILLFGLVVIIALFFAFRELLLWYWKINERIKLQKEQNTYLKIIAKKLAPEETLSYEETLIKETENKTDTENKTPGQSYKFT